MIGPILVDEQNFKTIKPEWTGCCTTASTMTERRNKRETVVVVVVVVVVVAAVSLQLDKPP